MAINTKLSVSGLSGYKRDMATAKASVKELDAELKLAEAEYKATGDAATYYQTKARLLSKQIEEQKKAVSAAEAGLAAANAQYGEGSRQAQAMRTALTNARTTLVQMQTSLTQTTTEMGKMSEGAGSAGESMGELGEQTNTTGEALSQIAGKLDAKTLQNGIKTISDSLKGAAAKAASLAKSLWQLGTDAGGWADDLVTRSTQTGIDTTTLQQWEYAARFVDTEADTIIAARKRILSAMSEEGMSVGGIDIATTDASGQLRDWDDVFWDSIDALQGIQNATERDQAAMELFGKSYQDMLPLIKAGREEWEQYAAMAPTVSEDNIKKLGALDDSVQEMTSQLNAAKLNLLASLAPILQSVAEAMGSVAEKLGEYLQSEEGQQLLERLGSTLGALTEQVLSPDNLQKAFDAITAGAEALSNALLWISENKETVVGALEALGAAFLGLQVTSGVLEFVRLLSAGKGLLNPSGLRSLGGAAGGGAGSGAGAGTAGAAGAGVNVLGYGSILGIAAGYTRAASELANVVDKALDAGSRQAQTDAANAAAAKVAGTAYTSENQQRAAEAFANIAATWGMTGAGAHGTGLLGLKLSDRAADSFDYSAGLDELMAYAEEFNLDLSQIFDTTLIERLTAWKRLGELNSQLEETGDLGDLWDEYDELTQRGDIQNESLGHMFGEVFDQMAHYLDTVDTLPDQAHSDGVNTSLGLAEGINEGSGTAIEAARNLADAVKNTISGSLDINSPSRVMAQLGAYTSEGFAMGIEDSLAQVREASGRMAAAALSGPVERAHAGGGAAAAGLDRTALGDALRAALNGVRVDMSGQAVGQIVADTVDEEIGRSAYNARYNT